MTKSKKLYRSSSNRVLGGVAAGIAQYFDLDPTIVRILFIILLLFGGSGLLLYIILWLVMPSGSRQTISEASIKEGAKEIETKAKEYAQEFKDISRHKEEKKSPNWFGILLVLIGVILLLNNFFFIPMRLLGPLLLVGLGVIIVARD